MNLTDQQIENWRKVMCIQFGTIVQFFTKEMIIKYAENLQNKVNQLPEAQEAKREETIKPIVKVKKCPPHTNVIVGSRGKYCLDCEQYV